MRGAADLSGRAVLQVNSDERRGGAAQVAINLQRSYRLHGLRSHLAVGRKTTDDPEILSLAPDTGRGRWTGLLHRAADKLVGLGRVMDGLRGLEGFRYPASHRLLDLFPEPPDLVHLHNLHGGFFDLEMLPRLSHRVPVVLTLHDAWLLSGHCAHSFGCDRWETGCGRCPDLSIYPAVRRDRTALNWARKRSVYAASRLHVATPSQWLMRRVERSILREGIVDARVIPNGVDISVFEPAGRERARANLGIAPEVPVLLFAASGGRQNEFKDFPTLRGAADRLAAHGELPGVVLLVVGGEERPNGHEGSRIRYLPFQHEPSDMASLYRAADVYLHAARADTFPNTVLEALACGTPVVATAVGGIPEQIRSLEAGGDDAGAWEAHRPEAATGMLVPPGDADAMASAVVRLLNPPALAARIGRNGARDARDRFSLEGQVRAYLDWFAEILATVPREPPGRAPLEGRPLDDDVG